MKKIFVLLFAVVLFAGCKNSGASKEWQVTVTGKVAAVGSGAITMQAWADTLNTVIPVEFNPTEKSFSKTIALKEPGFYRLFLFDQNYVDLILFKDNVQVEVNEQNQVRIKGSSDMDFIYRIDSLRNSFDLSPEMEKLNGEFGMAVEINNEAAIEDLRSKYEDMLNAFNDKISDELIKASPSIGVIQLLSGNTLDRERYFSTYLKVSERFTGEWLEYAIVKEFTDKVTLLKKTAIGSEAPEINLPDPSGKFIKLSDFRGKYVLVDFWAKWCGPCRRENPNLVKAYQRFKGENFEVVGVSLDRNKEDWLQAITEDGLTWVHLSDLKYFESVAARDYNINAIPYSVLIDPKGIIVAKNLRGKQLHETLEKFLKVGS